MRERWHLGDGTCRRSCVCRGECRRKQKHFWSNALLTGGEARLMGNAHLHFISLTFLAGLEGCTTDL